MDTRKLFNFHLLYSSVVTRPQNKNVMLLVTQLAHSCGDERLFIVRIKYDL